MDQEIKIEPAESKCFAELQEETFIKIENVCKPKFETDESAFLENPPIASKNDQGRFSCENEIKSEINDVKENCSKIEPNPPIKAEKEEDKIPETPDKLTCKQLKEIVRKGQEFTDFIKEVDTNVER